MTPSRIRGGTQRGWRRILPWIYQHRAGLGYAAVALAAFFMALLWSLPHELIARSTLETATAGGPLAVDFRSVSFAFPNGYSFSGLRLTPLQKPDAAIAIDELTVRAPLFSLLLGEVRALDLSGSAYGGTLAGDLALRGAAGGAVDLVLRDIDLARALAAWIPPPGNVAGRASLELKLAGDGRTTQSADGTMHLSVAGLTLRQIAARGVPVPDVAFTQADAVAQIAGPRVTVKQLVANGDDVNLTASGDVTLREPVVQSLLGLRLSIDIAAQAPPPLRVAAALLPRRAAGESSTYTLSGTIAAPVLR